MAGAGNYATPRPHDIKVGGWPMTLSPGPQGAPSWAETLATPIGSRASTSDPASKAYTTFPPEIATPWVYQKLYGGMGVCEQHYGDEGSGFYHYGLYVDTSGGDVVKGPHVTTDTSTAGASPCITGGYPLHSIEFDGAQWVGVNNVLYYNNGLGWVACATFVGAIGRMAVYQGTQSDPYLYIPVFGSDFYYVASGSRTATINGGSNDADHFAVVGDELWRAFKSSNQWVVSKSTNGGTNPTWGGNTTIGDNSPITWLGTAADRLFVFKENGLFAPSLDATTVDEDLTPELRYIRDATHGQKAITWDNRLVFTYNQGLWRYDPANGALEQFGPELLDANRSEVRGPVQSVAAHAGICLFAVIYNEELGHSYLVRYGAWRQEVVNGEPVRDFVPSWHGALYKWPNERITLLHISTNFSSPGSPNARLYAYSSSGNAYYYTLARGSNAYNDANYRFTTTAGELVYPRFTANLPAETKKIRAVGVFGHMFSGNNTATVKIRQGTEVSNYEAWGSAVASDPGAIVEPTTLVTSGQALNFMIALANGATTSTPVVSAFVIYARPVSQHFKQITFFVTADDHLITRTGVTQRRSYQDILATIEQLVASGNAFTITTPRGQSLSVVGVNYQEVIVGYDERTKQPRFAIQVQVIQSSAWATIRGTHTRLANYTHTQLAAFTQDQLETL